MVERPDKDMVSRVVFKGATRLYVIASIFMVVFVIMGIVLVMKSPQEWIVLAIACGVWVGFCLGISYLRLELDGKGLYYRNLTTNRSVKFSEVEKAWFQPVSARVAQFRIRTRQGRTMGINLRTFPIEAAALLFSLLDKHKIPIVIPDKHGGAVRMAQQIRDCQSRMERTT